ncbi:MAG: hypothetical protein ABI868_16265 [Acidobacteriota bacterium]
MPRIANPTETPVKKRRVSFRIMDIYIPDPATILINLHGHDILQGQVVDVSDNGTDVFMVVDVEGIDQPVIVPAGRISEVEKGANP